MFSVETTLWLTEAIGAFGMTGAFAALFIGYVAGLNARRRVLLFVGILIATYCCVIFLALFSVFSGILRGADEGMRLSFVLRFLLWSFLPLFLASATAESLRKNS